VSGRETAHAPLEVGGISVGGIETCIDVPALKLCFDLGRVPDFAVARSTVLFTHAHMDHLGGIAWHTATRALRGMAPPTYVIPRGSEEGIDALFQAWRGLDRSELPHQLVPLSPQEEYRISPTLVARAFHSPHTAPCQGYALISERKRLRDEFRGLTQEQVRTLSVERKVEVAQVVRCVELAFTGDTRPEVLERESLLREARVLVMECTFLDDRVSARDAHRKGHVHLDHLLERAHLLNNERIVLTHFSARYSAAQIVALLDKRLPKELRERVRPLLGGWSLA
jgi:ribonuclease Z